MLHPSHSHAPDSCPASARLPIVVCEKRFVWARLLERHLAESKYFPTPSARPTQRLASLTLLQDVLLKTTAPESGTATRHNRFIVVAAEDFDHTRLLRLLQENERADHAHFLVIAGSIGGSVPEPVFYAAGAAACYFSLFEIKSLVRQFASWADSASSPG